VLHLVYILFVGAAPAFKFPTHTTLREWSDALTQAESIAVLKHQVVDPNTPFYAMADESQRKSAKMCPVYITYWWQGAPRVKLLYVETLAATTGVEHLRAVQRSLERYGLKEENAAGDVCDNCGTMTGNEKGFHSLWERELQRPLIHVGCMLHIFSLCFERVFRAIGGIRPTGTPAFRWHRDTGRHIENLLVTLFECCAKKGRWELWESRLQAAGVAFPKKFLRIIMTRWGSVYDACDILLPKAWGGQLEAIIFVIENMEEKFLKKKLADRLRNALVWLKDPTLQLQLFTVSMWGRMVGKPAMNWAKGKGKRHDGDDLPSGFRLHELGDYTDGLIGKLKDWHEHPEKLLAAFPEIEQRAQEIRAANNDAALLPEDMYLKWLMDAAMATVGVLEQYTARYHTLPLAMAKLGSKHGPCFARALLRAFGEPVSPVGAMTPREGLYFQQLIFSFQRGDTNTMGLDPYSAGIQELARSDNPPAGMSWTPYVASQPAERALRGRYTKHFPYKYDNLQLWLEQRIFCVLVHTTVVEGTFQIIDQKCPADPNQASVSATCQAHRNDLDAEVARLPPDAKPTSEGVRALAGQLRKGRLAQHQAKDEELRRVDVDCYSKIQHRPAMQAILDAAPPREKRHRTSGLATDKKHPCEYCGKLYMSYAALNQHQRLGQNCPAALPTKMPGLFLN